MVLNLSDQIGTGVCSSQALSGKNTGTTHNRSCITMTERVSPSFTIHGWAWWNSSTIRSISLSVIKNQFWVKWPKSGNSFWTFSFVSAPKLFPFLVESFVPVSNAAAAASPPPMAAKISEHESGLDEMFLLLSVEQMLRWQILTYDIKL